MGNSMRAGARAQARLGGAGVSGYDFRIPRVMLVDEKIGKITKRGKR